jgi:hypothetical protein
MTDWIEVIPGRNKRGHIVIAIAKASQLAYPK